MNYILENNYVSTTISSLGAQMLSITGKNGTEFLWNGDKTFWEYHAPILFPFIGKLIDDSYTYGNKKFQMSKHGFARTSEFEMIEQTDNRLKFKLCSTEETKKVYPFDFNFFVIYTLVSNEIKVTYKVENKDDKIMYFSVGAHPAFRCPLGKGLNFEDYYLEFNEKEDASLMLVNDDCFFVNETKPFLKNENIIPLNYNLFNDDALVFSKLKSTKIALKSKKSNQFLELSFENFPYLGIWTKTNNCPFICIEPWFGFADYYNFQDDVKNKIGIEPLNAKKEFSCNHTIKIFE